MADEEYLSYEQVLQELQIDRSQLNRLIRDGLLKEQIIEGETRFAAADVAEVKTTLEKRPTVVDEGEPAPSRTDIIGEGEAETAERETDVLQEAPSREAVERDTEILVEGEELQLEEPGEEPPAVSDTALETDVELAATKAEQEAAEESDDFFDFTEGEELQLEEPQAAPTEPAAEEPPAEEEEEEIITDILDLEAEEQVAEEDLLSEIMEIGEEEEPAEAPAGEDTEDLTAEITTLEEPTYEESALDEVLEEAEEEPGFALEEEAFEVPYAAPVVSAEAQVGGAWVAALVVTLILLVIGGIFAVENTFKPEFSTGLTSWARSLAK